jgi:hypothetical protein
MYRTCSFSSSLSARAKSFRTWQAASDDAKTKQTMLACRGQVELTSLFDLKISADRSPAAALNELSNER